MVVSNLEPVAGLVERVNPRGIKLLGAPDWLNISQYHPLAQLPIAGQRVDAQVQRTDRGAWINSLEVLDGGQVHDLPRQPRRGAGGRSPAELREIRRLTVLKAAAAFGASRPDVKSGDVLSIADRWLAWVERSEGQGA